MSCAQNNLVESSILLLVFLSATMNAMPATFAVQMALQGCLNPVWMAGVQQHVCQNHSTFAGLLHALWTTFF